MAGGEEIRDIYSDKFQICAHTTHVRKSQICTLQGSNLSKYISSHPTSSLTKLLPLCWL